MGHLSLLYSSLQFDSFGMASTGSMDYRVFLLQVESNQGVHNAILEDQSKLVEPLEL